MKKTLAVTALLAALLVLPSDAAAMRSLPLWTKTTYSSATLTGNGNSGILAFADQVDAQWVNYVHYGMSFVLVGASITTDETIDLTMDFYTDAAGTGGSLGTITFNQITAGSLTDLELYPGDITAFTKDTPVPPYFKLTWTLAGTTKSMTFILYGNFWRIE